LRVYDRRDKELPNVGLIKIKDAETQQRIWTDTSNRKVRMLYKNNWEENMLASQRIMTNAGIDSLDIEAGQDYVQLLLGMFRTRNSRRN
ncbi:MAG: DUF58 domain-containing protein, partial [Prevotellaceae bacterium]|jgi:uncharacterized protein (DUF58 family)|nr:DUF58 domain-containing protein [Prevotellaceae bacterium]